MKCIFIAMAAMYAAVPLYGGITAYIFTNSNTPASGFSGEIVGIQAYSTNTTGVAALKSVTTLAVGGKEVPFTNSLASVTLAGGIKSISTNGVFIASKQRVIVSGTAFPGGAITVWVKQ